MLLWLPIRLVSQSPEVIQVSPHNPVALTILAALVVAVPFYPVRRFIDTNNHCVRIKLCQFRGAFSNTTAGVENNWPAPAFNLCVNFIKRLLVMLLNRLQKLALQMTTNHRFGIFVRPVLIRRNWSCLLHQERIPMPLSRI